MMGNGGNTDSDNILQLLKKGSRGTEIGVWKGFTTKKFLLKNPSKLYIVDPWSVKGYSLADEKDETKTIDKTLIKKYKRIVGSENINDFQKHYDKVYQNVCREFKKYSCIEICRMSSDEWFSNFDEEKLDWIYIDGDHSFSATYKDLVNSLTVLKSNGIIIGDDYLWDRDKDKGGVKKAVTKFCLEMNLNVEKYGTRQYMIRKF
tara:strand:- start:23860 stop:24471 length:612 start_codon:yes stop_codon:yes gene_type:complete